PAEPAQEATAAETPAEPAQEASEAPDTATDSNETVASASEPEAAEAPVAQNEATPAEAAQADVSPAADPRPAAHTGHVNGGALTEPLEEVLWSAGLQLVETRSAPVVDDTPPVRLGRVRKPRKSSVNQEPLKQVETAQE